MSLDAPESSPPERAEASESPARTGSFDALGHVFAISCTDLAFAALIETAFAALAVPGDPAGWYWIRGHGERFDLTWQGETVISNTDRASVLAWLHWDVNRRAVVAADADLVLHAGCVARDGRAIVISGASGSGKSTLVAAFVAQHCDYVTDEALPLELATGHVRSYPRPLALDDLSLDLLPEITPLRSPLDHATRKRLVVIKPGPEVRDHSVLEVAMVLFPERDDSGLTVMEPLSRGDAIIRLAENAFNFPNHEQDAMHALTLMVDNADPYRIVGDDPRTAASAALEALASTAPRTAPRGEEERCHERRNLTS
jgi:hypothetical protein